MLYLQEIRNSDSAGGSTMYDVDFDSFEATHAYWRELMVAHWQSPRWGNADTQAKVVFPWFVCLAKELESSEVHSILKEVCASVNSLFDRSVNGKILFRVLDEQEVRRIDDIMNAGNLRLLEVAKQEGLSDVSRSNGVNIDVAALEWRLKHGRRKRWIDDGRDWIRLRWMVYTRGTSGESRPFAGEHERAAYLNAMKLLVEIKRERKGEHVDMWSWVDTYDPVDDL